MNYPTFKARIVNNLLENIQIAMPGEGHAESQKFNDLAQRIQGQVVTLIDQNGDFFEQVDNDWVIPAECFTRVDDSTKMTLLPCPFCGGTAKLEGRDKVKLFGFGTYTGAWCVKCTVCKCSVGKHEIPDQYTELQPYHDFDTESEAIAAWNRRADQDTLNKAVKLIDELLEKEPLYALGEWPSLRDALSILTNKGASHE